MQLFQLSRLILSKNALFGYVFSAEWELSTRPLFLTKLTLIARSGYLYGYWTALTDVQLAQQHELAEAQQIEPRNGAQNRKKGGSP